MNKLKRKICLLLCAALTFMGSGAVNATDGDNSDYVPPSLQDVPRNVVNVAIPYDVSFTISLLTNTDMGWISSRDFEIVNKGENDVFVEFKSIHYEFVNESDFESVGTAEEVKKITDKKAFFMQMNCKGDVSRDSYVIRDVKPPDNDEEDDIIFLLKGNGSGSSEQTDDEREFAEGEDCSEEEQVAANKGVFSFSGSVNPLSVIPWKDRDVSVYIEFRMYDASTQELLGENKIFTTPKPVDGEETTESLMESEEDTEVTTAAALSEKLEKENEGDEKDDAESEAESEDDEKAADGYAEGLEEGESELSDESASDDAGVSETLGEYEMSSEANTDTSQGSSGGSGGTSVTSSTAIEVITQETTRADESRLPVKPSGGSGGSSATAKVPSGGDALTSDNALYIDIERNGDIVPMPAESEEVVSDAAVEVDEITSDTAVEVDVVTSDTSIEVDVVTSDTAVEVDEITSGAAVEVDMTMVTTDKAEEDDIFSDVSEMSNDVSDNKKEFLIVEADLSLMIKKNDDDVSDDEDENEVGGNDVEKSEVSENETVAVDNSGDTDFEADEAELDDDEAEYQEQNDSDDVLPNDDFSAEVGEYTELSDNDEQAGLSDDESDTEISDSDGGGDTEGGDDGSDESSCEGDDDMSSDNGTSDTSSDNDTSDAESGDDTAE